MNYALFLYLINIFSSSNSSSKVMFNHSIDQKCIFLIFKEVKFLYNLTCLKILKW